jgi:hypothetical protein
MDHIIRSNYETQDGGVFWKVKDRVKHLSCNRRGQLWFCLSNEKLSQTGELGSSHNWVPRARKKDWNKNCFLKEYKN